MLVRAGGVVLHHTEAAMPGHGRDFMHSASGFSQAARGGLAQPVNIQPRRQADPL
jgi:hypothetical protein